MPTMPPQHSSMPDSRTIWQVSQRSSQEWRGDHVREVASGRPRGCGCSGARPCRRSSSTCSWVSMPSDAATLMSTAAWIAATPSRICAISRSSGPRTAATMQNSVAPVAAVCFGGLDQRGDVQPDRAHRRGELPGLRAEVAVLRAAAGLQRDDALDLDLGAAPPHPHLVGEREQVRQPVVAGAQHLEDLLLGQPLAAVEHLLARASRMSVSVASAVMAPIVAYARYVAANSSTAGLAGSPAP